jgi:5'-nucleotidase/UDP-sugar diphosphatase
MKKLLLVLLALSFNAQAKNYTPGKSYKITILHTNDHHGAFWKNEAGEYGMAARATLISQIR